MLNSLFPHRSQRRLFIKNLLLPPIPVSLKQRFIPSTPERLETFSSGLLSFCFPGISAEDLKKEPTRADYLDNLHLRLDSFRNSLIPWIRSVLVLEGARVLEIGCGTGSTTLALAEQGCQVTAVDIEEPSLQAARLRCEIYGVRARFLNANAAELGELLAGETFDLVIFPAVLEHMTFEEKKTSLRTGWELLSPGGFLCISGTPNRLYCFDDHTADLPFFLWLPDEVAFEYFPHSPMCSRGEQENTVENMLAFIREGRGVSYHELELCLGPLDQLHLAGDLESYRRRSILRRVLSTFRLQERYARILKRVSKGEIPVCFFRPYLDVILRKE